MATQPVEIEVNPENAWRTKTPGPFSWNKSIRTGANKYFMISADAHLMPPHTLFRERLDKKWHSKLPRVELRDGIKYLVIEGMKDDRLWEFDLMGEDLIRSMSGASLPDPDAPSEEMGLKRITDQARDGVDGELIFPNGPALLMWSSADVDFVSAQCQVWNDWAWEVCEPYKQRCNPAAAVAPVDVESAVKEIQRIAKMGYRAVMLPCKPVWNSNSAEDPNYNLPMFDPLWAAIQDADLAICYHISTGKDPRGARGKGGAVINYVVHSLAPTLEPIVNMCASGVFERFPKLRAATIEANAGWVPWMIDSMDEAYRKHHMWVRPKLKNLPSDYYRSNCFASIAEDRSALELVERYGLENNLMWANDYPHHEGTWPHSAEAIERTFGDHLREETRTKILGMNAAKVFRFEVPEQYRTA
ncbi:MAG TPA: amidohydrolase family protein [Sphingobium sp.]